MNFDPAAEAKNLLTRVTMLGATTTVAQDLLRAAGQDRLACLQLATVFAHLLDHYGASDGHRLVALGDLARAGDAHAQDLLVEYCMAMHAPVPDFADFAPESELLPPLEIPPVEEDGPEEEELDRYLGEWTAAVRQLPALDLGVEPGLARRCTITGPRWIFPVRVHLWAVEQGPSGAPAELAQVTIYETGAILQAELAGPIGAGLVSWAMQLFQRCWPDRSKVENVQIEAMPPIPRVVQGEHGRQVTYKTPICITAYVLT